MYGDEELKVLHGRVATRFLGLHCDMHGDNSKQISMVYRQTAEVITFLSTSNLTTQPLKIYAYWGGRYPHSSDFKFSRPDRMARERSQHSDKHVATSIQVRMESPYKHGFLHIYIAD